MILAAKLLGISVASAVFLSACGKSHAVEEAPAPFAAENWADARAEFLSPNGSPIGDALFKQAPGGVMMRIKLVDLSPGWHGVHLHQIGDCSDGAAGFKASGGHVNPDGRAHGLLNPEGHERADLPNIFAGADGRASAEFFAEGLSLSAGAEGPAQNGLYNLLDADGFAVVVHANADDHMTQPIGGAGARMACAAVNKTG
ncbi:superoxide dismutase family protein [Hyphococcus sp.]|uniref:superoxide dismutase family protein n=1 Tax=Hyphococcus sp. TaxID=2038636 RepID=UPI0037512963